MVVLDAAAGNRRIWPNKNPPYTVFMDMEIRLAVPPDIFADFKYCPFRDKVFDCVIFDPPFHWRNDEKWMFFNPDYKKTFGGTPSSHYGLFKSRNDLIRNIANAQKEFQRISDRLCFKWGEGYFSLWRIMSLFRDWTVVLKKNWKSKGYQKQSKTWWVTFILPPKERGG